MDTLKKYLAKNEVTMYQVAKTGSIGFATLSDANKRPVERITGKVLFAISKTIGKTPGTVLDELIEINK